MFIFAVFYFLNIVSAIKFNVYLYCVKTLEVVAGGQQIFAGEKIQYTNNTFLGHLLAKIE